MSIRKFRFPDEWLEDSRCIAVECAAMLGVEPNSNVSGSLIIEREDDDEDGSACVRFSHRLSRQSDGISPDNYLGATVIVPFDPRSHAKGLASNLCHSESEILLNKIFNGHEIYYVDGVNKRGRLNEEAQEALEALEKNVAYVSRYDVIDIDDYFTDDDSVILRAVKDYGIDTIDSDMLAEWARDTAMFEHDVILYGVERWVEEFIVRWADNQSKD